MKLRIKGASIRLRLTRSEVAGFATTGTWSEETPMPGGRLRYVLQRDDSAAAMHATWSADGTLTVFVPAAQAAMWTSSEEVTLRGEVHLADGTMTKLLVEKDFACKDNTEEDQTDNYPHPNPH
ncbi:hypothetical protein N9098_01150 [bacterium]|jgi:hypothetical protein|nr:hypothetical protein [bacterium]